MMEKRCGQASLVSVVPTLGLRATPRRERSLSPVPWERLGLPLK